MTAEHEDWVEGALREEIVGWLTTVTPAGAPQTSVVSFLWVDGEILIYSVPKTPKVRNIEANPSVAFNLNSDRYGDQWLSIEGVARIDNSTSPIADHAIYAAKYTGPLQHWKMDLAETSKQFSTAIWIRPTRIRSGN